MLELCEIEEVNEVKEVKDKDRASACRPREVATRTFPNLHFLYLLYLLNLIDDL